MQNQVLNLSSDCGKNFLSVEKNWFEVFDYWSIFELIRFVKIRFAG